MIYVLLFRRGIVGEIKPVSIRLRRRKRRREGSSLERRNLGKRSNCGCYSEPGRSNARHNAGDVQAVAAIFNDLGWTMIVSICWTGAEGNFSVGADVAEFGQVRSKIKVMRMK